MTFEELQKASELAGRLKTVKYIRGYERHHAQGLQLTVKLPGQSVTKTVNVNGPRFFGFMKHEEVGLEEELAKLGVVEVEEVEIE